MPDTFSLLRNDRDAWAAIRGYAYQVDRTLVSWLKLGPGEALELECGEDIDLLAPSLSPQSADIQRTLEQVKCLDRNVTLRSISTREALCSFFDHVQENPSVALHFRFLTNALPGEENPAYPLLFVPGIQLWKDIRHDRVEAEKRRAAIESIGSFLQALGPPRPTMADSWQKVLAATRDFDRLSVMIANLDWSTAAAGPEEIVDEVEQLLLSLGHADTKDDAKARHDQLFVFVLRMLARRRTEERRRLDLQTLESCLASVAISAPERELMSQMKGIRELMLERFTSLDANASETKGMNREILSILQGERREVVILKPVVSTSAIRESFRVASAGLLAWPQETRGRWLERPELKILENTILAEPQSCTLLLGPPGAGKSAILARLGTRLERTGTLLLALKTDQLPQNVERLGDLDAFLDLQIPLVDTILELARRERVVLLIDQLDALASLMDQRTNRLHVVLQLIHRLKGTPNVHLVISCRQFDFQYDSRFASLKADPVYLADPPFEDVRGFLNESGVNTGTWPSDMCQMLRNPQHLNIFLSHFGGDSDPQLFGTYQSMLEATFKRRVLDAGTALTPEACEQVAAQMSETEELWIGRSAFDQQYPTEIDRLIAAGILQEKGRTVGFRHQTLFDYVRTRAFCTGVSSLSAHILARQDSVFVRSTAWASLHALRASSFERYRAEMETLWAQPALRKHLRLLLISFLGQVAEPDVREVQWLLPALENAHLRGKVLAGVFGNPAWFARLQSRLPGLMADPDALLQGQITILLRAALEFDRPSVLRLVSRHWSLPESDPLVLQVFHDFSDWDDETTWVIEVILQRQSVQPYFVVHIAQSAAKKRAGYGARLMVAAITNAVQSGIEQVQAAVLPSDENGDGLEASMSRYVSARKRLEPVVRIIDTMDWHGLEDVAEAEPAAFAAGVLPLVLRIGSVLASPESHRNQYQTSTEVELDGEIRGRNSHILQSLKLAFQRWAEKEPDAFLRFAGQVTQTGLLIAHRLLAYGFERAACARPDAVMTYLVGDARRLSLGGYQDQHHETRLLIAAVSAHLPSADLHALEQAIAAFDMYKNAPDDDAETRWRRRRWNREHRLRLLRSLPTEKLSADARKHRNEEEIALPGTRDYDSRIEGGFIGSPVSATQMGKAADEDVLNLFTELRDDTGTSHPRFSLRGGSYQASQALAAFAKEYPARAIAITEQLKPSTQELPAAYAVYSLAQSADVDPGTIVDLIMRLSDRGFSSSQFREQSGWALQKLADRCNGLPDAICEMLETWITPASGDDSDKGNEEEIDRNKEPHSILWGLRGGGIVPHGNYPYLVALEWGYRCRTKPDIDRWLEVLCRQVTLTEDVAVWRALVAHLDVLGAASDRNRALEFLRNLFDLYPGALTCANGVFFLAAAIRWLPAEFMAQCLRIIERSNWARKEQAIGEIAMLCAVLKQKDEHCRSIVDSAVEGKGNENGAALRRVGIAFASVNLWTAPEFRTKSHAALIKLARDADGYLPGAVMDVFRRVEPLPPDAKTWELLSVIADNPAFIQRGETSFLIDRLKELLADGFDPSLIAAVTRSLLTAGGSALGDIRTSWALNARDLIEITITLQRIAETRSVGLDQFETLMDLGAYEASQVLRELDRRPV